MAKQKKKVSLRKPLTDESVSDVNFFKEDIDAMDSQLVETEKLYDEIHSLFENLAGGEYMPSRNIRDLAEISKSLSTTRALCVDIISKRTGVKKIVSDVVSRKIGTDTENDIAAETARQIVAAVSAQAISKTVTDITDTGFVKPAVDQSPSANKNDEKLLEKSINAALKSGDIVMTKNDKYIAIADHVVPKYDTESKRIVAVDSRDGTIIDDFPEERLPSGEISSIENNRVRLNTGEIVNVLNADEFVFNPEDVED